MTDQNSTPPAGRARVLVVDDSPTALYLLRTVFESEQYDVVTATDGNEGLDEVHRRAPDLIVTDSVMPGLDGFALLRRLRENPATRLIPVVMLTSGDPSDPEYRKTTSSRTCSSRSPPRCSRFCAKSGPCSSVSASRHTRICTLDRIVSRPRVPPFAKFGHTERRLRL